MTSRIRGSDNFDTDPLSKLDWDGIAYVDPDAIGANATAKIYPDGSIVGSVDNGSYTKWPNGNLDVVVIMKNLTVSITPNATFTVVIDTPISSFSVWDGYLSQVLVDHSGNAENSALAYIPYDSTSGASTKVSFRNIGTITLNRFYRAKAILRGRWKA